MTKSKDYSLPTLLNMVRAEFEDIRSQHRPNRVVVTGWAIRTGKCQLVLKYQVMSMREGDVRATESDVQEAVIDL